eukprot:CAMPEP_0177214660 /NCGR_PEP_ID=MMETSP0367-20130122/33807_1 /TAXON_ID=447022 ORGANISM="Scrippsiella hangoei-like, Strain SHHI-4" /NCGR_SAMPLE_ID=MMETSP0367 /ASSEMBLY_ACC=CAM_ASM_000362 /LENGTH=302 /DNA_ID=CAMNT_0018664053 /DNA_START=86 /DNA_END=991 /DNA_ORIENTATION=+
MEDPHAPLVDDVDAGGVCLGWGIADARAGGAGNRPSRAAPLRLPAAAAARGRAMPAAGIAFLAGRHCVHLLDLRVAHLGAVRMPLPDVQEPLLRGPSLAAPLQGLLVRRGGALQRLADTAVLEGLVSDLGAVGGLGRLLLAAVRLPVVLAPGAALRKRHAGGGGREISPRAAAAGRHVRGEPHHPGGLPAALRGHVLKEGESVRASLSFCGGSQDLLQGRGANVEPLPQCVPGGLPSSEAGAYFARRAYDQVVPRWISATRGVSITLVGGSIEAPSASADSAAAQSGGGEGQDGEEEAEEEE